MNAQKPHAWAVKACSKMWTGEFAESDAQAEAARMGCMGHAYPLFTKPTPPESWEGAVKSAQFVYDSGGLTLREYAQELSQAILDMDAKLKELK